MNSVTLLAFLIFSSTSRGGSYSDFSELADGEDLQNEFFEDEVGFTSNSEVLDSTQNLLSAVGALQTNPPYYQNPDEEQTAGESVDEANLRVIYKNPIEHPAPVLSALNEVGTDKHLSNFLVHPFDSHSFNTPFPHEEAKPYQSPKRREIAEWKDEYSDDSNNVPWAVDAYLPKLGDTEYYEDVNYSDDKSLEGPSVVVAGDYKDQNSHAKQPQYFQKNYYYNYYPLFNDRKKWNHEEIYSPEESKKRLETAVGRKMPAPNPCKQYLEFLKYAFERLDENSEYYYEPNEEYAEEWRDSGHGRDSGYGRDAAFVREPDRSTHRIFGTHLLGPTFYVDNSGKISQVNTNGNSIQVAEGISPESKISIFSKSPTKPKTVTEEEDIQTSEFTTPYSPEDAYTAGNKPESKQRGETESHTSVPNTTPWDTEKPRTATPGAVEQNTIRQDDVGFTDVTSNNVNFRRMGRPMKPFSDNDIVQTTTTKTTESPVWLPGSTTNAVQTATNPPVNENRIKVKTLLTIDDSTAVTKSEVDKDADCKDKMLPCPDTVNITYPLNGYCNRYVSCESGRAIRRTCPEGLHFNLIIKSCDLPHNSFCTYFCPEPNGNFGIPGDCGGYFVCKNSNLEYRMCPPRMHWDISRGICTFSQLSSCPMKCFRDNEVRHYEGDCKAYIVCLNGMPYYHKCPPNTKFDANSLVCVPDHLSKCVDDPRLLTKTLNPNTLCKDVEVQINTKSWCRSFMPFESRLHK